MLGLPLVLSPLSMLRLLVSRAEGRCGSAGLAAGEEDHSSFLSLSLSPSVELPQHSACVMNVSVRNTAVAPDLCLRPPFTRRGPPVSPPPPACSLTPCRGSERHPATHLPPHFNLRPPSQPTHASPHGLLLLLLLLPVSLLFFSPPLRPFHRLLFAGAEAPRSRRLLRPPAPPVHSHRPARPHRRLPPQASPLLHPRLLHPRGRARRRQPPPRRQRRPPAHRGRVVRVLPAQARQAARN